MPPADRALILEFLTTALVRLQACSRSEAHRRSWRLLGGLLVLDYEALRQVVAVCDQAAWWDEDMSLLSKRTRRAVSRYYTVCARAQVQGSSEAESAADVLPGLDGCRRVPFVETAATARREAGQLGLLDAWLASGRPLSAFLELWEPTRGK